MCTTSAIGDNWRLTFPNRYPNWGPNPLAPNPLQPIAPSYGVYNGISRLEFDQLKAEMAELKKLLLAAQEFDKKTGQPNCEIDEKVAMIKKIAEMVGVDMSEVFK